MSDLLSYKNYNGTVEYSREDNYGSSIVRKTKKIRLKENTGFFMNPVFSVEATGFEPATSASRTNIVMCYVIFFYFK